MRQLILVLAIAITLNGCSSSSVTPSPTSIAMNSYKDSLFGFSLRYPASWTIAKQGGRITTIGSVKTYVLDISVPRNAAQVSVTVDANVVPIPPFQNGHTAPDPNGPTHTFQYFHARVAGWPAMIIRRFTSRQITEVDTVTNTRTRSYDVRMLTATPPFSSDITAGYNHVVTSFKVPFS